MPYRVKYAIGLFPNVNFLGGSIVVITCCRVFNIVIGVI